MHRATAYEMGLKGGMAKAGGYQAFVTLLPDRGGINLAIIKTGDKKSKRDEILIPMDIALDLVDVLDGLLNRDDD